MENTIDQENWMSQLPLNCHTIPLHCLALPGSHNSFTFGLDKNGELSSDAPAAVANLVKFFGPLAKSIIHNWSTNQSLSTEDQLKAGIRYFDIRVGTKPGTNELFAVHGLYGPTITSCLDDICKFLDSHPKEVVLLDFNHFYGFDSPSHSRLVEALFNRFSSKMCPVMTASDVTLQMLWEHGLQLIVFYHQQSAVEQHFQLWPDCSVPAPWHNTTCVEQLLTGVDKGLNERTVRYSDAFHVTQAILTPDNGCIMRNLGGTLKSCMAAKVAPPVIEWLRRQKAGSRGINVVAIDCVETADFASTVIGLNFSLKQT